MICEVKIIHVHTDAYHIARKIGIRTGNIQIKTVRILHSDAFHVQFADTLLVVAHIEAEFFKQSYDRIGVFCEDLGVKARDFLGVISFYIIFMPYKIDGEIKICECGFHFCDTPLATFQYYSPNGSRYALVEAVGQIVSSTNDEHKFCTDELKILKEFTLAEFIQEADRLNDDFSAATNTGDCSAATNTGDCSAATNTGDYSAATSTGYFSAASVTGKNSIAFVSGKKSKAKGAIGCWLVLTEWNDNDIAEVRAVKVDGEHVKPDTFYTLLDGKVIEVDDKN